MATLQNLSLDLSHGVSNFLRRPRYLRAIPSLMVLTTAMAWGVLPDGDVSDDTLRRGDVSTTRTAPAPTVPSLLPAPGLGD